MKSCHHHSLLVNHPGLLAVVCVLIVVLYVLSVRKLEKELDHEEEVNHEKQE